MKTWKKEMKKEVIYMNIKLEETNESEKSYLTLWMTWKEVIWKRKFNIETLLTEDCEEPGYSEMSRGEEGSIR